MNLVVFFLVAAALLLAVLALVLPALFGRGMRESTNRTAQNLAIARERLEELKLQQERGDISASEYDQGREDIERGLADDLASEQREMSSATMGSGRWAVVVVGFGIPVLAGSLYLGLGKPTTIGGVEIQAVSAGADNRHPESMDQMVANLAARLQANPSDAQGWSMLGSSYMAMKRFSDAATALGNLRKIVGDDPNVLVRYADALAMAGGGRMTGKPAQLVKQALTIDPNNSQGLWMAGMAARQQNDLHTALTHWRKLEPALANKPNLLAELRQLIADATQRLGDQPASESASTAAPATASQAQPATEQTASAPTETPAVAAVPASGAVPSITVRVSVNESLQQNIAPTDAVFIFARALTGPPMPLAVVRRQAADLPITVTLDDSSAIMPAMTLSKFDEVMVGARISKTGTANPQSGDLQGQVAPVKTGADQPVSVTISQVIP